MNIIKKLFDWEHWPFYLFYFPIAYAWIGYYIRTRSLWFYTSSNPTLAFGGFEGEGKINMYKQLPGHLCPRTIYIEPSRPFELVKQDLSIQAINYPLIVKPDIGMKGILCRKVESEEQLLKYHSNMSVPYLIQEFIDLPYEVSVFYCRRPNKPKGEITALIMKHLPEVTGDGVATIAELLQRHPHANGCLEKWRKYHQGQLEQVLPKGETYRLSHIANLFNGAWFTDLSHMIDDSLVQIFDDISYSSHFYYGRYDIKCTSINEMKEGKNFYILEFNGAGSVPNHIYTGGYTLITAYKEILRHWKAMYEISVSNNRKGWKYWSLLKGYKFLRDSKSYFNKLKKLDQSLVLNGAHSQFQM